MSGGSGGRGEPGRFEGRSADGAPIAVWVDGEGPPLVLVHGAHERPHHFEPLVAELRPHVTTFSVDRRGRGAGGDADRYSIEREFEDVAAVVDAVAHRTASPVAVWGHSYGANCALGAAALTGGVNRMVLYEPGLGWAHADGAIEAIEEAVAAGEREAAVLALLAAVLTNRVLSASWRVASGHGREGRWSRDEGEADMRARTVAIVAGLVGGIGWMGKIVVMAVQDGPDEDSLLEALAFFAGLGGVVIAAAAVGAYLGRRASVGRRVVYAVGAVVAVVAIVGLGQAGLTALPGDSWVQEEAIFGIAGLVSFVSAMVLMRARPDTGALASEG
jgi:pimeloyl-ACP methyl ester carboxylesterase